MNDTPADSGSYSQQLELSAFCCPHGVVSSIVSAKFVNLT